ncbi:MAG: hypothetical protein HY696_02390 [Deltaproteobacteria bacterium]|nr:hypothetical protein [Deltaproteobacteria bacterium]
MKKYFLLCWLALPLSGCAFLFSSTPPMSQAEIKQLETRTINAPVDVVFTAATEALFDLGYLIKHSERSSGVLLGEKQHTENEWVSGTEHHPGHWREKSITDNITLLIQPENKRSTSVRVKTARNGEQRINKSAIDEVWVLIDRQVLMSTPPTKSPTKPRRPSS